MSETGRIETRKVAVGPSGRIYALRENGDGVRIQTEKGELLFDCGCYVEAIPLIDVPIYALRENGDGVRIQTEKGELLFDCGCYVEAIPLIDVPILAQLLAEHRDA